MRTYSNNRFRADDCFYLHGGESSLDTLVDSEYRCISDVTTNPAKKTIPDTKFHEVFHLHGTKLFCGGYQQADSVFKKCRKVTVGSTEVFDDALQKTLYGASAAGDIDRMMVAGGKLQGGTGHHANILENGAWSAAPQPKPTGYQFCTSSFAKKSRSTLTTN